MFQTVFFDRLTGSNPTMQSWKTEGFEAFRQGKFGNGGHNIYVSRAGVLQRIHRTSLLSNGYMDLVFCNSQAHEERVPIDVYPDPLNHPEIRRELFVGGAADAAVADFSGEGREDMAWACTWDGMTLLNLSAVFYNSDNGPSDNFVSYLPAPGASYVAAGDFKGDGRQHLVYRSKGKLVLFWQDECGFGPRQHLDLCDGGDVAGLAAHHFAGDKCATLFIRHEDGSVTMLKEFVEGAKETPFLPKDPAYVKHEHSWDSYTQAVSDSAPKLRFITVDGTKYLTVFRQKCLYLYPVGKKGVDVKKPVKIDVEEGSAAEAGDIFGRGCSDLVVTTRTGHGHNESSYIYLGGKGGFSNKNRLELPSYRASDVALGNFSGGKGLDIVVCQSHTHASFDCEVLVFPTATLTKPAVPEPKHLPAADPTRVLVIHDKAGRPYLVVGNHHSGSYIGNPDNDIYFGSATGYHVHDKMTLPGWGSVDMICADFNDDGKADIAFANGSELAPWMDFGSYVYYQKDGQFSRQPQRLHTNRAHGVIAGDFNHDGYLDLLFCGFDNDSLRVYYGGPNGFSEENCKVIKMQDPDGTVYKQPRFISVADLNGDGYLDLILSCIDNEVSYVLWGGPEGFDFSRKQAFKVHHVVNSKVADLNGNGYPDLIWASHSPTPGVPNDSYLYIYWGGPEGYSENRKTMLPCYAANSLCVADFNNDGLLDIFVASYQNAHERDLPSFIYWNSPEGFNANRRSILDTHAVSGSIAADFNDDGHVDLAIANHKVMGNHIAYSTVWYNGKDGFDEKNTVNLPTFGPHGMCNVDPGNIMDRSFDEYYESVPHKIPKNCGVRKIYWDATIPRKCDVFAQLRVADSLEELEKKPWLGPTNTKNRFRAHDFVDKLLFSGKYVQYRLSLYAHNGVETPRVKSVTVEFEDIDKEIHTF